MFVDVILPLPLEGLFTYTVPGDLADEIKPGMYGTPPHGGFAIGLERLIMVLCGTDNIRDVVAFPTNNRWCLIRNYACGDGLRTTICRLSARCIMPPCQQD